MFHTNFDTAEPVEIPGVSNKPKFSGEQPTSLIQNAVAYVRTLTKSLTRRRKGKDELDTMTDRMLRDVGVSRYDLRWAGIRPSGFDAMRFLNSLRIPDYRYESRDLPKATKTGR